MEAAQAISLVAELIRSRNLDYPTEDLAADRFEAGWNVYAPVEVDESDPMAFLEMPVGRSVFMVGDSGRIEETSSSVPPRQAEADFTARELARRPARDGSDESEFMAEFERQFRAAEAQGPPAVSSSTIVDGSPGDTEASLADAATAEEASQLIDPIVQQLAQLGPPGWEEFSAEFAFTVSSQIALLRFWSGDRSGLAPVPQSVAELVRRQREVSARMSAGPWWRLLLRVTNEGETTVDYDYGDDPFPDDQLVAPEHYRHDLETFPRKNVPVWIAGFAAGPAAQGRDPRQAAAAHNADGAEYRTAVATDDVPALPDLWARWAVLAAAYVGVGSEWGPRVYPGYVWYESDYRSGSTLIVLPGDRAVLSGGTWNSELLDAAYNGGGPLPDLYAGAPPWVNDSVLNSRNRNGLLSFCYWWAHGRWYRGGTDTSGELVLAVPAVRTSDEVVEVMVSLTGPDTTDACQVLLTAAGDRTATLAEVAAIFANKPDADIDAAVNQLSLGGLLAT